MIKGNWQRYSIVGTPPPPLLNKVGEVEFPKFLKKEAFRFFWKKGGVGKIRGHFKGGIAYFHSSVSCISAWRGIEPLTKYSKGGEGLGTEILEGGDLFEGGPGGDTFYIKNKLKSEIFKSKKKKIS